MKNQGTPISQMQKNPFQSEVVADRAHVVYHADTGALCHVHRITTLKGAKMTSLEEGDSIALRLAARYMQDKAKLRVLRMDSFEAHIPQRVNVKTGKLEVLRQAEKKTTKPNRSKKTKRRD
jgi:hypothetical protein